jgi:hypothetical protein
MTTMHIQLDEAVAHALQQKALRVGKAPEQLVAEMLTEQMGSPPNKEWIRKFLEDAERNPGKSGGWKWNRDELYDR